jgi:hypothetical protein
MNPYRNESGEAADLVAAPHEVLSPLGNWLVDGPNGRTVWSSIQALLLEGAVRSIT